MNLSITPSAIILLLLISTLIPTKSIASQPHTHGEAELTIIIENEMVHIALVAPAESLVGFEHRAKTDSDLLILTKVKKTLSSSENTISLQGGTCLIKQTDIEIGNLIPPAYKSHQENEVLSTTDKHADKHAEITAQYLFNCKEIKQLTSVSIELFQYFNAIKHINVRWVTTTAQNSTTLHRANKHLQLR